MKKRPQQTKSPEAQEELLEPKDVLTLLKQVVLSSLSAADYNIALKAIELWGKELGLFMPSKQASPAKKKLSELSTKELEAFLKDNQ